MVDFTICTTEHKKVIGTFYNLAFWHTKYVFRDMITYHSELISYLLFVFLTPRAATCLH